MTTRRILVIGAHPDDCDIKAGGAATLWRRRGHEVRFVSMTCGDAGHHQIFGARLAELRRAEAQAAAGVVGIEYLVLDHHDGQLEATLENRLEVVRLIRAYRPDLVLSHRPNDYHPDHRYCAQLVQDAAYMVTVPGCAPDALFLKRNPTFGYLSDDFMRPCPFRPDLVLATDEVAPMVIEMLHCHASQFYEWLPFNFGIADQVPEDDAERKEFLRAWYAARLESLVERCRPMLIEKLGHERGTQARFVEAFEISEYGARPSPELLSDLFGDA